MPSTSPSVEAQSEARILMMSTNNILSPANGKPIINPTQDIVLGIYYMTRRDPSPRARGRFSPAPMRFESPMMPAKWTSTPGSRFGWMAAWWETTVGRVLVKEVLPEEIPFSLINKVMKKSELANLIDYCYRTCGDKKTVILSDRLKDLGIGSRPWRVYPSASMICSFLRIKRPCSKKPRKRSRGSRSSTPMFDYGW